MEEGKQQVKTNIMKRPKLFNFVRLDNGDFVSVDIDNKYIWDVDGNYLGELERENIIEGGESVGWKFRIKTN